MPRMLSALCFVPQPRDIGGILPVRETVRLPHVDQIKKRLFPEQVQRAQNRAPVRVRQRRMIAHQRRRPLNERHGQLCRAAPLPPFQRRARVTWIVLAAKLRDGLCAVAQDKRQPYRKVFRGIRQRRDAVVPQVAAMLLAVIKSLHGHNHRQDDRRHVRIFTQDRRGIFTQQQLTQPDAQRSTEILRRFPASAWIASDVSRSI